MRILLNDGKRSSTPTPVNADIRLLHESMDGYLPSPLVNCPSLAERWDAARATVKVENDRWGLPSFKIVGTAWATVRALAHLLPATWTPSMGLAGLAGELPDELMLVAATEGNHGEALAHLARLLAVQCRVFVSSEVSASTRSRIAAHGAELVTVPGTYDDAVVMSAAHTDDPMTVVISDTSWNGYEEVPRAVADGYTTILAELDDQLRAYGGAADVVVVPMGVGALASAVIKHYRGPTGHGGPVVVGVEPTSAACVMASLAAGRRLSIPGHLGSTMAGLNCGTPSLVAWPDLQTGLDAVVAVSDDEAESARSLATEVDVAIGPCSRAAMAAADWILSGPASSAARAALGISAEPTVVVLATDGPSGPPAPASTKGSLTDG